MKHWEPEGIEFDNQVNYRKRNEIAKCAEKLGYDELSYGENENSEFTIVQLWKNGKRHQIFGLDYALCYLCAKVEDKAEK